MAGSRWGLPELQILGLLCGGAHRGITGYALADETKLSVSTVYQVLNRFEEHALVVAKMETVDPRLSQRAPRTLYCGTTVGADQLTAIRALLGATA